MKAYTKYILAGWAMLSGALLLAACIPPNAQHTLTILASPPGSGTVVVDPVKPVYAAGTIVNLEAVPAEGWSFLRWDAPGVNTTQNIVNIAMFSDVTATALFVPFETSVQPVVQDSGFEEGPNTPAWAQSSTNFDTLICNLDTCDTINGIGPHAGQHWAAFGNAPNGTAETASLSQLVGMPASSPIFLQFFLAIPVADASFIFQVALGENVLLELTEADQPEYTSYKLLALDISEYAGMDPQVISFNYQNALTEENQQNAIFLDDVILLAQGG